MIKNQQYIKLDELLSRILRHRQLQDVNLEAAIQYTIDFMEAVGVPDMFQDKEILVPIKKFRGDLPCDLLAINQVMDMKTHTCMRSMTDTFDPDGTYRGKHASGYASYSEELTFKVQNTVIVTSFECGEVKISYKAIPVDEDGKPLIINNSTYLKALELYIKQEVFTEKFDNGEIPAAVMQKAERDYAFKVGQLAEEMNTPSESEMESLMRSWCTMIPRTTQFDSGFRYNGDREYLRQH